MTEPVEVASAKDLVIDNGITPCPSHDGSMLSGVSIENNLVLYLAPPHRQRKPRNYNALQALSRLVSHHGAISPVSLNALFLQGFHGLSRLVSHVFLSSTSADSQGSSSATPAHRRIAPGNNLDCPLPTSSDSHPSASSDTSSPYNSSVYPLPVGPV